MTVPGKPGLVPVEVELVAGLAVGEGDRDARSLCAAGKDPHALRDADVHLGGEAIGHEAGGGEPARGIEQVGDGLLDGGQLEAFDGAVFAAGDDAVVLEGPVSGLAGSEGGGRGDANGAVGGALASEHLAGVVGDLGDLQARDESRS